MPATRADVPLASYTTLGLGGPASTVIEAQTTDDLVDAVRSADTEGRRLVVIGGGSNLVVADDGWDGDAILIRTAGVEASEHDGSVEVRLAAGVPWDAFVEQAVRQGWSGVECLAGIPGLVGATPVQNVGAYGQEIADTLVEVTGWDRAAGSSFAYSKAECEFGYRTSVFKHTDRYVVTSVTLSLRPSPAARPIRYTELARRLDVPIGACPPVAEVRDAVVALRRRKGMVLDAADPDTRSAGSFFTNPIVDADQLARLARGRGAAFPSWPESDGRTKLSAAWLIENAGFGKGFQLGRARLSTKHTLALTNVGGATTAELLALARVVRDGVRDRFGIELRPEPRLLGAQL